MLLIFVSRPNSPSPLNRAGVIYLFVVVVVVVVVVVLWVFFFFLGGGGCKHRWTD